MTAKTYKFLEKGARSPFSGFQWPMPSAAGPGSWVEARGPLRLSVNGLHVCGAGDLPYWLHDELWEVETDGESLEGLDCRVVRRARLVRAIEAWGAGGAERFARACIEHVAARADSEHEPALRGFLQDAMVCADAGYFAVGAYCAAQAATKLKPNEDIRSAFREERGWQGAWIARELLAIP
jgi:hypothetical protein